MAVMSWEKVQPLNVTFQFADAARAKLALFIRAQTGKPLYRLSCYTEGSQPQTESNAFLYSGDFECRLVPLARPTRFSTLFTEDREQSRDWESRARFFWRELEDPCGDIPEFGRRRTFRLRGMRIQLLVTKLDKRSRPPSLSFAVSVRPDTSARSDIVDPPTIDRKWAGSPCKLNNSVTPKFR
jgi:hypothetical protein